MMAILPLMTIVYKDYKIGAEIDAARFSYTPRRALWYEMRTSA